MTNVRYTDEMLVAAEDALAVVDKRGVRLALETCTGAGLDWLARHYLDLGRSDGESDQVFRERALG